MPMLGIAADSKVSALTEDTAPTTDDLVYTVNDPGGTPASRKATIANLLNLAIKLQSTLQSGATFYVSSGTVNANFTVADLSASQFVVTNSVKTLTSQATINDTDLTSEDFGDFTCDSLEDGCTFDADTVGESELLESMNFVPTGAWDWGGATSLEIPQAAAPTVNAIGEIALDTSMADFQHSIVYATSTTAGEMYVIAVSSTDYHDISDNDIISYDAASNKFILEANAGGGAFSDASDPIVQNTTGKDVHFGDGAGTLVGKVELGGDADQPQMVIEGFSTQTDSIFIIQNDADTQVFNIDNDGTVLSAVGYDCIGAVDCDFGSADVTDMVFTTDSTGDGEITLPNDSIGPAEIDSTAGAYDFGGVTSFEIPQAAAPTVNAVGEIALDTSMANFQPLITYATSTSNGEMYVIAVSSTEVHDWSDGEFVKYDSATKKFIAGTPAGSGDITDVYNCSTGDCADIAMGAADRLDATSGTLELPQNATPTLDAVGEISLDTSMVDHLPSLAYSTSTTQGEMYVIAVSSVDYHDIADNNIVVYDAASNEFKLEANAGGGAFSDSADPIVQNTTTKDVHIGDGAGTLTGKLEIGGDADQPQLVVEGFSTQTDSIMVIQNDADTEVFTVDNSGLVSSAVGFDCIGDVDCDFGSADVDDFTFTTDGTGTAEIVLPAGSIDSTEVLDGTLVDADMANDALDADKIVGDSTDDDDLDVAAGGTGVSSLTDGAVLLGSGAADITTQTLGDTQIMIGDGAGDPTVAALSGDATMTNGGVVTVVDDSHNHVISNIDAFTKADLEGQTSDVADYAEADGDTYTGAHDFGGATSLEIPQAAAPTVDAVGELALDTSMANFQNMLVYSSATTAGEMYVIAVSSTEIHDWSDGEFVKYDSATKKFIAATPAGSGDITDVFNCASGDCADIAMGASDRLDATSGTLELPQNAEPTLDAVGEIALDTSMADFQPLLAYATATANGEMYVIAVSSTELHDVADNDTVSYDATTNKFLLEAGGASTIYHRFEPESAQFLTTNFPQIDISTFTNFPVSSLNYDATTSTEAAHWKFRATDYSSGNLTLDIYWFADTATSGDVVWSAAIAAFTSNTDTDDVLEKSYASFNSVTDTHLGTEGRRLHQATITISNLDSLAGDDLVWIQIGRNGSDASGADDMTGDANLVYAVLSY